MSLQTIRDNAFEILQLSSAQQTASATLSLALLNQARLKAERDHDFVLCNVMAYLSVTATTGSLISTATDGLTSGVPSGSTVLVKSIKRVEAYINSQWVQLRLLNRESYAERQYKFDSLNTYPWTMNDPEPLPTTLATDDGSLVVWWFGGTLFTNSTSAVVLRLYCSKWLASYATIGATADFMITYGEDWLMWSLVVALNHKSGTFVPKNEGSVDIGGPLGMRGEAWDSLILWDTHLHPSTQDILAIG